MTSLLMTLSFVNGVIVGYFAACWVRNFRELRRLASERTKLRREDAEDAITLDELEARRREWLAAVKAEHELYDQVLGKREVH